LSGVSAPSKALALLHCDASEGQECCRLISKTLLRTLCYHRRRNWLHTGVEFMKKLAEIRNQEFICRERAMLDSERKIFWLAQAEEWEQRALDEIAFHFRECNLDTADSRIAAS
jgi:hypothetical protein